jgi:glycosyltransferase involved in cell wall biosynthesis
MPAARITTGFAVADTENLQSQVSMTSTATKMALRAKLETSGLMYLYVGQFIRRKGVRQLLEAWGRFEHASPRSGTLVLIGAGPEAEALKTMARDLALKAVRFPGWVDYDQLAAYYAAADVFVMPTLEDNWSMVVPEAMVCGLPVLTSYYNGCWPELVQPDVNGWVFDSFNTEEVARCLTMCVVHQDKLPQMGQQSKQIVSHHTPLHSARAILQACEIALRRWKRR